MEMMVSDWHNWWWARMGL